MTTVSATAAETRWSNLSSTTKPLSVCGSNAATAGPAGPRLVHPLPQGDRFAGRGGADLSASAIGRQVARSAGHMRLAPDASRSSNTRGKERLPVLSPRRSVDAAFRRELVA